MLEKLLHYSAFYKAFLGNDTKTYSHIVNKKLAGFNALDQGTIYQFLYRF